MNAVARAANAGMPCPSTPPRELKIAIGTDCMLYVTILPPWPGASGDRIHIGLHHRHSRIGSLRATRLCTVLVRASEFARIARIDVDELYVGGFRLSLDTPHNAAALVHWCAAHGITLRATED